MGLVRGEKRCPVSTSEALRVLVAGGLTGRMAAEGVRRRSNTECTLTARSGWRSIRQGAFNVKLRAAARLECAASHRKVLRRLPERPTSKQPS